MYYPIYCKSDTDCKTKECLVIVICENKIIDMLITKVD